MHGGISSLRGSLKMEMPLGTPLQALPDVTAKRRHDQGKEDIHSAFMDYKNYLVVLEIRPNVSHLARQVLHVYTTSLAHK